MADILLKCDSSLSATYIPNTFIDKYMTHADGEFVKIYLYLLRCINSPDTPFSISGIADKFDYTEKDVKRALKYWEKMHLLRLEFDNQEELTGICLTDSVSTAASGVIAKPTLTDTLPASDNNCTILTMKPAKASVPAQNPVNSSVIQNPGLLQFQADENVKELLYVAERYLGRPLTHTETQKILYWMDHLGFSQDLIDYLIEQCVAKDRPSIQYMDKVALDWAKQGIHTLSAAKQSFIEHSETVYAVKKAFGISSRDLSDYELDYVKTWSETMGFSDDIIVLACQKTLCSIQKISFKYTNSIMEKWQEQNVHTLAEIKSLDVLHQKTQSIKYAAAKQTSMPASIRTTRDVPVNTFTSYPQRTYDYDALERELLFK